MSLAGQFTNSAATMPLPEELQHFLRDSHGVDCSSVVRCILSYLDELEPASIGEFVSRDDYTLIKALAAEVVRSPSSEGGQQFMQTIGALAGLTGGMVWQNLPLDFVSACLDSLLQDTSSESLVLLSTTCIVEITRFCCSESATPQFCDAALTLMQPSIPSLMSMLDSDSEHVVSSSLSILFALHRTSLSTHLRAAVRSHPNVTFLCSSTIKALNRAETTVQIEEICGLACAFLSSEDTSEFFYPADLEVFMQILLRELALCLADNRECSEGPACALTLLVSIEVALRTPWHKKCKYLADEAFTSIQKCCLSPDEEVSFVAHQIIGSHF
jgi:hypothetical protein